MARDPVNVEEELLAQQQEDFEEQQQRERMAALEQEQQNSPANLAKEAAKSYAKNAIKTAAKEQAVAAASAAGSAIVSTAPVWGPILLVLLLILALIVFVVMSITSVKAVCDASWWQGANWNTAKIAAMKLAVKSMPGDVCANLSFQGGRSGGAGAGGIIPIDIVLTSAYRPGSFVDNDPSRPSAHGRGEAFDVAVINPPLGFNPDPLDPRVTQLINLAKNLGFGSPVGDVVDEYNNRSSGTTGPHIHIEFNSGQCDGRPSPNPPTDLVSIPSTIPMQGVSNPQVRKCMLPHLLQFFLTAKGSDV